MHLWSVQCQCCVNIEKTLADNEITCAYWKSACRFWNLWNMAFFALIICAIVCLMLVCTANGNIWFSFMEIQYLFIYFWWIADCVKSCERSSLYYVYAWVLLCDSGHCWSMICLMAGTFRSFGAVNILTVAGWHFCSESFFLCPLFWVFLSLPIDLVVGGTFNPSSLTHSLPIKTVKTWNLF